MSDKYLLKIKQYTQKDLINLFQKHGLGDVVQVLSNNNITNGVDFLNITELQILRWKVPPQTKTRIIHLLHDINKNPQLFISEEKQEKQILNKNQTIQNNAFLHKLQKTLEIQTNKPSLPRKPQMHPKQRAPSPPENYLSMELKNQFEEDYLQPVDPNTKLNVLPQQRPPQILPRNSTDYFQGPDNLKTISTNTFPRVKNTFLYRQPIVKKELSHSFEDEDQDTKYEYVDIADEEINIAKTFSTGIDFSSNNNKYENAQIKNENTKQKKKYDIRSRPLPPLPDEKEISKVLLQDEIVDELSETYENIEKTREFSEKSKNLRTQSNLNLDQDNSTKSKAMLRPKMPLSYEKVIVNAHTVKTPLPLPPMNIPTHNSTISNNFEEEEENESEDYGSFIFNVNDEPFYRFTDRKGAKSLLYGLDDGAFLFRPSKNFFLTLSLKYQNNYFNLGIEKTQTNKIRLNTSGDNLSPEFATLTEMVQYFSQERLTFEHQGQIIDTYLKPILPNNRI